MNTSKTNETQGPLSGVRVLDFSQLLQGPYATQMLGDLGADVIKVERPGAGDAMRSWTFWDEYLPGGQTPCFLAWNRNKRSIAVDLKSTTGCDVVRKLAATADIVVENFRPGVMERLGLGYAQLREINRGIIYASSSGWGSTGPYASRPGQDMLVQGLSGALMANGRAGQDPVPIGTAISDQLGALHITYSVLAALYQRTQTGEGQQIEVSLLSATLALQSQDFATVLNLGRDFERPSSGIGHPGVGAPQGVYRTADGYITLAPCAWDKLVQALGDPSLMEFEHPRRRFEQRDEIWRKMDAITRTQPTAYWLEKMLALDIWVAEVKTQSQVPNDPQVQHMKMFTTYEHPTAGKVHCVNVPVQMSGTKDGIRRPPPLVGQHTTEVLRDAGFPETMINDLFKSKVLYQQDPPAKKV
jgi:crotonobetainyl-CoA:carnitine CoA-transferase CaiB-like acyl-CoA transferase